MVDQCQNSPVLGFNVGFSSIQLYKWLERKYRITFLKEKKKIQIPWGVKGNGLSWGHVCFCAYKQK